jgi:predicted pyridoxine 5'-phosphate oxidase superfamily flavin-nucleotide-binding protein
MANKPHDYHDGNRYFHDRFDTGRLAERSANRITDAIGEEEKEFIEGVDMFFLASCDHRGFPTCSYKGGDPGFVKVLADRWLAFPNYDGNGQYLSMGNLRQNPNLGMLFVDFEGQRRLRVQGVAEILEDDPLMVDYPGAQFIVRVQVNEVFRNCPRYIHKYKLVERSKFVPRDGHETPIAEWKLNPEVKDLLPANDPARNS